MQTTRRPLPWLRAGALLLLAGLALSCASEAPPRLRKTMLGGWINTRHVEPREGAARVLNVFDGLKAPQPHAIRFLEDGTYQASYDLRGLRELQRIERRSNLPNPVQGEWSVHEDWLGLSWLKLTIGAPSRRMTVLGNTLQLHPAQDLWENEKYRRAKRGEPLPGFLP